MARLGYLIDCMGSGGAQSQLAWVAGALDRSRYQPCLAWYDDRNRFFEPPPGVPVRLLPRRHRLDPRFGQALLSLCSPRECEIVHAWLPAPALYAALARLGPRSVPVVSAVGCAASFFAQDRRGGLLHVAAARLADHTTVNARDVVDWLVARGVDRNRVSFVPNIVPPAIVVRRPSRARARADLLRQSGLDPSRPPIVQLARLDRNKNAHGLLAALLLLRQRGLEVPPLVLAGAHADPALVAELRRTAEQAAFDLRVLKPVEDVATWMEAARLTALASFSEGTPNVVLEALGLGGLVVATGVGEVPALIRDGETGFLATPGDTGALAAALARALALPQEARQAMGERARADVLGRYRAEVVLPGLCDLYDEVRARARPPWRRPRSLLGGWQGLVRAVREAGRSEGIAGHGQQPCRQS